MRNYLLAAACLFITLASQAQVPPTGGPAPVPVDGGVSLLVAGGVAYGLRRLKQRRASKS